MNRLAHSPDEPLLRLIGVDKVYGNGVQALAGISCALASREFVSLLGPSGCGKSSILRLIAGLMRPSAGRIEWRGGVAARLGFVFQEPTLLPWARVRENVRLPLRLAGISGAAAEREVDAALDLVGLGGFGRAFPRELSGGMKMRVSIARALVTAPDLLLMDEPFAALDEMTRFKLNDDLRRLWAERALSCLFVTHSVYESVYLSTRILVMASGPGRIADELAIAGPDARDADFRSDPLYTTQCRAVSAALHAHSPS